ncbi:MAG: hypothetical protein P8Y71_00540 [Pseudolabrys sp.]|jgi:hypothetical protein
MDDLSMRCPETSKLINIGVDAKYENLTRVWNVEMTVPCPHCGHNHTDLVRDAYMDQTIADFRDKSA